METRKAILPIINSEDRTLLAVVMQELLAWQQKQIDLLKQEILKLKGETTKPEVNPSKMDKDASKDGDMNGSGVSKQEEGPKRSKTGHLKINATVDIQPDKIQEGTTVKGYREVVIQDIVFETFNTCYGLSQYQTPDGSYVSGQLPDGFNGCHKATT